MKKSAPPLSPNLPAGAGATKGKGMPFPTKTTTKKQKDPPALAKLEEKYHTDFDKDGEKGEPAKHAKKVLSGKPLPVPPKDAAKAKKLCAACKKAGKSSCSHM